MNFCVVRKVVVICVLALAAAGAGGETLLAASARIAADGDGFAVKGEDGWLFARSELQHIAAGRFWGEHADKANAGAGEGQRDPLAAIVDYSGRLKESGVELIFVPIPAKSVVYPEKLSKALPAPEPRPDVHHQEFYALLRERGVRVLDVTDRMIESRDGEPLYCRTDAHFSPAGARLVAKAIAAELGLKGDAAFATNSAELSVLGDLARDLPDIAAENLKITYVAASDGSPVPDDNTECPVLLMTDSHGLIFHAGGEMLAAGGGLADLLALEIGMPVDLIAKMGSAATAVRADLYRRAKKDPDWFARKKTVVWLMTVRELTTSPWSAKVPVKPQEKN